MRALVSSRLCVLGPAVRADFRRLYPANAKTPTCCPSDDNRTKVTNSVTSARSLWWHVGPYFWPADLTRTANPITLHIVHTNACARVCTLVYCLFQAVINRLSSANTHCKLAEDISVSKDAFSELYPVEYSMQVRNKAYNVHAYHL